MGQRAIHFVFAKGEDTAIHNPIIWQNDSEDDKYYNLSGQRVETPSKPGIYMKLGIDELNREYQNDTSQETDNGRTQWTNHFATTSKNHKSKTC